MKIKILLSIVLITFSAFLKNVHAQPGKTNNQSKKAAEKWFHKKEWLNGLHLAPSNSINIKQFANQYYHNKALWDSAFAFLKNHDLKKLAIGKYFIDGDNVFASVTEDATKNYDKTNWESHRRYIDLQYVIEGEEKIAVFPVAKATVIKPYDSKKDVANYSAEGKIYDALPGTFFIFFPVDAHRPNITPGGNKPDKKIVIKIKAAE